MVYPNIGILNRMKWEGMICKNKEVNNKKTCCWIICMLWPHLCKKYVNTGILIKVCIYIGNVWQNTHIHTNVNHK